MRRLLETCFFVLVSIVLLQSCNTEVELCYYSEHPHRAALDVRYDWGSWKGTGQHPERMYVLAHRIVNTYKYVFSTETKTSGNRATMLFPVEEQIPLCPSLEEISNEGDTPSESNGEGDTSDDDVSAGMEVVPDDEEEVSEEPVEGDVPLDSDEENETDEELPEDPKEVWHKMRLKNGRYRFLTFNCDTTAFGIKGLEEFQKDPSYNMENLYLRYKTVSQAEKEGAQAWKDYNLYADFVESENMPIFYTVQNGVNVNLNERVVVNFTPRPVTQKVTVKFIIDKEKGVRIDSLLADMSGIPSGMQLATGYLETDRTYKMLFKPTCGKNNENATIVNCTGVLNVTGIVRSHDASLITGPGIMQLVIYTSATDPDTKLRKRKVIQCIINLRNTLTKANLIRWAADDEHIIQTKKTGTLDIRSILKIEKGMVVEDSDNETGLDRWGQGGQIDIDA
ncbi:MAG: DUF5119 domain-containing protein [Paraprevotella sp.]|nr:DUF5119 domain-containing protein [Paraprevotella sp.]